MNEITKNAIRLANEALVHADRQCRWHGSHFIESEMWGGEPRCDSCKQPWRVGRALDAIDAAVRESIPSGGES